MQLIQYRVQWRHSVLVVLPHSYLLLAAPAWPENQGKLENSCVPSRDSDYRPGASQLYGAAHCCRTDFGGKFSVSKVLVEKCLYVV
jgi:hypothetical protein